MVQSLPSKKDKNQVAGCFIKLAGGYNSSQLALALWAQLQKAPQLPSAFEDLKDYMRSRLGEWIPKDQKLHLSPFNIS